MDDLKCKSVRQALWGLSATPREDGVGTAVAAHLRGCRDCEEHYSDVRFLRAGLRQLPVRQAPPLLATRLRVVASRERARQLRRRDFRSRMIDRFSRARLFFDNLLKPLAVPAAGGLLCSFLCFGVLVDSLHYAPDWQEDMPIAFTSEVAIEDWSPFCFKGKDVTVQLTVDSEGRVTDFSMPQNSHPSSEELQEIGNLVLFSTFTPAMRLGRPVSSKRLFNISHMSVRG